MARVYGSQIVRAMAVVGALGVARHVGRGALHTLLAHHNDLFIGTGSGLYDRLAPLLIGRVYRRIAQEAAAAQPTGVLVDVGCGPGHVALEVTRIAPGLKVCGVDISADMVDRATSNAARAGLSGRLSFQTSEPGRLPFDDASIDMIISSLSMHHWSDAPAMLRELARVLRPGGRAWIYDVRLRAMDHAAVESAAPGAFATPQITPYPARVGPVPLRRFVRFALERA